MRKWNTLLIIAALTFLLFILAEGISSVTLVLWDTARAFKRVPAEKSHVMYDPDLGWAHKPGVSISDLYRPGTGITINLQSLRADKEYSQEAPEGKVRVICLGDSFTLGYGVGNDQTWCSGLELLNPRFEAINMGQGGYGLDQAYLWYQRDGAKFKHQFVIFAFIADDFRRLQPAANKPYFLLQDGRLILKNSPVPRGHSRGNVYARLLPRLEELSVVRLVRRMMYSRMRENKKPFGRDPSTRQLLDTGMQIFQDFAQLAQQRGAIPVFVYLPTIEDYRFGNQMGSPFAGEFSKRGLLFLDLTPQLQTKTPAEITDLFFKSEDFPYAEVPSNAARHYTPAGHQFAATHIYSYLTKAFKKTVERIKSLRATT
ncbi:MAG: hypothetical protein H6757_00830 [Candidatus Omnitrophica bacterium]|nr:hypothetical protein [Candidatus Omnitrophota bacterium]